MKYSAIYKKYIIVLLFIYLFLVNIIVLYLVLYNLQKKKIIWYFPVELTS